MVDGAIYQIDIETIFIKACKFPCCKIERNTFLRKQLSGKVSQEQLSDALEKGTINAGIPICVLDDIANGAIRKELTETACISFVAGLPGGFAVLGTIPGDLVQFYAHVFCVAQKLAYIYGHTEINLDDATQNDLMIFLGVMFGVEVANAALAKFAIANATKIGTKVAENHLSKLLIYNIAKKILAEIGIKLTKDSVGKAITKLVPVAGGVASAGLTVFAFSNMAKKLKKRLSKFAYMPFDDLERKSKAADTILVDKM